MKKILMFIIFSLLLSSALIAGCASKEESPAEKTKKVIDNAYSDYVDKGKETLDVSKELGKDIKEKVEKEKNMLLGDEKK